MIYLSILIFKCTFIVMPLQEGIHFQGFDAILALIVLSCFWIPAFAGRTTRFIVMPSQEGIHFQEYDSYFSFS